ncbi:MAG: rhomboid family intramembrane serine protease [Nitrososphaerales archaeon]
MWAPVTAALLAINVLVFAAGYLSDTELREYSLVPAYLIEDPLMFAATSLTTMFLHAGMAHIAFNMLALFTLGRILEPHIGSLRFVVIYMLSGFAGSGLHTAYSFISGDGIFTPVVGASGAISGVIGIAAALGDRLALFWLVAQIPFAFLGFASIAYFAHIGGFIFGFAAGRVMLYIKRRKERYGDYTSYM